MGSEKERIAELEQKVGNLITERYAATMKQVEETRKRLFGYRRDKPASDGGKIIG